jgi:hypothetical protein
VKGASERLRRLADAYDADLLTYGEEIALDILVSDLSMALDDLAAVAGEVRDAN